MKGRNDFFLFYSAGCGAARCDVCPIMPDIAGKSTRPEGEAAKESELTRKGNNGGG